MVSFKQFLICVIAPLLIVKIADASFGYCVAIDDAGPITTAYAFRLYNDRGDSAFGSANSFYNNGALVSDSGWTFGIGKFDKNGNINALSVRNPSYNFDSPVPFQKICGYNLGGQKSTFYGCYDNGGTFCQTYGPSIRDACHKYNPSGDYTITC
ncbi:hypothetical protein BGZ49_001341 [Haplosporangium sp. Z 27]|nr:hypothetical protein BGZ49_001341 [Haplosporangium sp. Z 27]